MKEHGEPLSESFLQQCPFLKSFLSEDVRTDEGWQPEFANRMVSLHNEIQEKYGQDRYGLFFVTPLSLLLERTGIFSEHTDQIQQVVVTSTIISMGYEIGKADSEEAKIDTNLLGKITMRLDDLKVIQKSATENLESFLHTIALVESVLLIGVYLNSLDEPKTEVPDVFKKFLESSDLQP